MNNNSNGFAVSPTDGGVRLSGINRFSLADTLDCGQAFRWHEYDGAWHGVAHGRRISLRSDGGDIVISGTDTDDFERVWRGYFDLDRDYDAIVRTVSANGTLRDICAVAGNIRILRQDPWEALCSFIISQNNNIPRIKGIIERLCAAFGDDIGDAYSFPAVERIAALSVDDLAPLRSGFRAKYIIDAARKVASGEVDLDALRSLPADDAAQSLMRINGVGPKVAACALLFGSGRIECFPVDVWIRRAMAQLFPDGLPAEAVPYAGIVQQYIFHYARLTKLQID